MAVELVHPEGSVSVSVRAIVGSCDRFASDPGLLTSPYSVRCGTTLAILRLFADAIEGHDIQVTSYSASALSQLSDEFEFRALSRKINGFLSLPSAAVDEPLLTRVSDLEERIVEQQRAFAGLEARLSDLDRLTAAVASLERFFHEFSDWSQGALQRQESAAATARRANRDLSAYVSAFRSEFDMYRIESDLKISSGSLLQFTLRTEFEAADQKVLREVEAHKQKVLSDVRGATARGDHLSGEIARLWNAVADLRERKMDRPENTPAQRGGNNRRRNRGGRRGRGGPHQPPPAMSRAHPTGFPPDFSDGMEVDDDDW
jgi:hypothetical protein